MVGSIDPRCETVRGTHWPNKVAWLFGARVAETILASGPKSPHQQAGHMDASDPIRPSKKLLWHGGRPHMGPGSRSLLSLGRDDSAQSVRPDGVLNPPPRPFPIGIAQAPLEDLAGILARQLGLDFDVLRHLVIGKRCFQLCTDVSDL